MKTELEWFHINDKMPERGKYVLIATEFCRYPAEVGFWNGYEFRDAANKAEFGNTRFWAELTTPHDVKAII